LFVFTDAAEAADNVGMLEVLQNIEFSLKPRQGDLVSDITRQHLQCNLSVIDDIPRPIDNPHPAFADLLYQLKWPNPARGFGDGFLARHGFLTKPGGRPRQLCPSDCNSQLT
jgi:hypothetical protein